MRLAQALNGLADHAGAETAYLAALQLHRELDARTPTLEPLAGLVQQALIGGDQAQIRARADDLCAVFEAAVSACATELPDVFLSCYRVLRTAGDVRAARVLEVARARARSVLSRLEPAMSGGPPGRSRTASAA